MGRPSDYSEELADEICAHIASGKSLTSFCKMDGNPCYAAVINWLNRHSEFVAKYTRAREMQAEYLSEEIQDIADETGKDPATQRLRVDTRKWRASKMLPKKYGDKIDLNHGGQPENPVNASLTISFVNTVSSEAPTPIPTEKI